MKVLIRLIFVLFLSAGNIFAQDSLIENLHEVKLDTTSRIQRLDFSEEQIEIYRNDKEFSYLNVEVSDNWWSRFKDWLSKSYHQIINWLFGDYQANSILSFFLQLLPYLLLMGLFGFLVWLFIRFNPGEHILAIPEEPQVFLSDEEKIVKSGNIQEHIEQAIKSEDYRLAVRYYYLQLLKLLNKKEIISYEFQKTDTDYLDEITTESLRSDFKKILRVYDFIWYGNFPINFSDFKKARQIFEDFKTSLKNRANE